MTNEYFMQRCLDLAHNGLGRVAPNPLVGAVLVHDGMIIGEGFHTEYGHPHAEVNAIRDAEKKHPNIPENSTLYVNLEPCNHHGKTPPCADLIINKGIKKVVIGCKDSSDKVSGKGIEKLLQNGCEVVVGILEKECRELNKTFYTFHEKHRPFIVLKCAQSLDGYIGSGHIIHPEKREWISNEYSRMLTHKWRSEIQAIMVGTNTAFHDNPALSVRDWSGANPIRITLDKDLRLPQHLLLFDQTIATLIFTEKKSAVVENLEFIKIDFGKSVLKQVLNELFKRNIESLMIEGGARVLNSFIQENEWDEARIFIGNKMLGNGVKAPEIHGNFDSSTSIESDILLIKRNP